MPILDHFKGGVITVILFIGFAGCLAPLKIAARKETMSFATCFSAGVILSVAFCHLLPDASGDLAEVTDFPLGNFLCAIGFFLVMFFEKVFMGPHEAVIGQLTHHEEVEEDCFGGSVKCTTNNNNNNNSTTISSPTLPLLKDDLGHHGWEGSVKDLSKSCGLGDSHHHHLLYNSRAFREGLESGLNFAKHMTEGEKIDERIQMEYTEKKIGWWVPFTLMLVLSFHSVIEGLALGSAERATEVLMMTIAILSHKFLAAVSLGISFVNAQVPSRTHVTYACFFSMMTPFGAVLGVIISSFLSANFVSLFAAVCQAIGSGTFLFISIFELLPEELSGDSVGWKVMTAFLGFLLMALVAIYI